jgi:hypothetical protein
MRVCVRLREWQAFIKYYEERGWVVRRAAEGFLVRTRADGAQEMCVHGGTTCTVVLVLRGRWLLMANVGDSTALLSGVGEKARLLPVDQWHGYVGMAAERKALRDAAVAPGSKASAPGIVGLARTYLELSADHSPESPAEFERVRSFRPSRSDGGKSPELLFVYDTLSPSKLACPPIFVRDHRSGQLLCTNRGSYYKNVRNEWATLVATPPLARYQDALAFTRSIGDLHLQTFGVSHVPEVQFAALYDWEDAAATGADEDAPAAAAAAAPAAPDAAAAAGGGGGGGAAGGAAGGARPMPKGVLLPTPFCVVLCSDGVWDNWKYEDISEFVTESRRSSNPSAQESTVELMQANLDRAKTNFGSSADNMTAILAYFTPRA